MVFLVNSINRPVHLARRDVFFERAVALTGEPIETMETERTLSEVERIQRLVDTATGHARKALRGTPVPPREKEFLRFLALISDNVQALHAMVVNRVHLEAEESFLCRFVACGGAACRMPAQDFRQRAGDSLQGLRHILRLAMDPYQRLRKDNHDALSEPDRARYHRAGDCARAEIDDDLAGGLS